jgi:heptosyltransferase-3
MGDCVLSTPAVALLKQHRPDLKITVIVEPRFAGVFEDNPDVDEIRADACRADLAINFHGGTRSMWMTLATRAKYRAGFGHHNGSFLYTHRIPRAQEILGIERTVHTTEHMASAMFWLGVPQTEVPRARLVAPPAPPDLGRYIVIHPFASTPLRIWPPERFIQVARALAGRELVFIAGPGEDASPFGEFRVWKNEPLARVKSLISGAALFIGNNSGPAHIAAAFGVPIVAVFDSSDLAIWGPWQTESIVLPGLERVTVEEVLAAVEKIGVFA